MKYIKPEMEIIEFTYIDIVTQSGEDNIIAPDGEW